MRLPGPFGRVDERLMGVAPLPRPEALPCWRLFLPAVAEDGTALRWRDLTEPQELSASDDWWELWERTHLDRSLQEQFRLQAGVLDARTAASLRNVVSGLELWGAYWIGYGTSKPEDARLSDGGDHWIRPMRATDLVEGSRLPQHCWDERGVFGWTSLLYPDSIIVSGPPALGRSLFSDPGLDLATVTPGDDLPPSAAD